MKFYPIFLTVISFVIFSCNGQSSKASQTIDAKAFSEKIATTPNPQILDVRTPEEFSADHLDKAVNVDWLGDNFIAGAEKMDKTKPVYVYCKSGGRSQSAVEKLEELGFKNVYQLQGGILKWDAAGLSKPSNKATGITVEEYSKLLNSDNKVMVSFYAEWCAPCKKMTPYITKMQTELADSVTIIRLDADKNKTLMSEMKITELPTVLVYEKTAVKWRKSGFISEEELRKQIQ
jgi:thioredoxin